MISVSQKRRRSSKKLTLALGMGAREGGVDSVFEAVEGVLLVREGMVSQPVTFCGTGVDIQLFVKEVTKTGR